LPNAGEMFQKMLTAYQAGADYIIIFNFPQINSYGALTEAHFTAMEKFWTRIHTFPQNMLRKVQGEVAFVLPKDYGWGMRNPNDNIWGLWPPDELSPIIWEKLNQLIEKYGLKIDIVYDDHQFDLAEKYSKICFWNHTAA
jgi:hypothetical protein